MQAIDALTKEEQVIYKCLNPNNLKSFFLFAGAGSGKTRSLVNVLKKFKIEYSQNLKSYNQKIAVITYTNAACEEIRSRLDFDDTFIVSTIHSFSWELIRTFQADIKKWVIDDLNTSILELEEKLINSTNKTTKTYAGNAEKLNNKKDRLLKVKEISIFSYEPNGANTKRDSLNHSEVIKITADFLANKPLLQSILIKKHPIILIDESQDTNKNLMDAFFKIQENNKDILCLGLFGDTMQRIYFDGKEKLDENIPEDWEKPEKLYNYRSHQKIIDLANKIRSEADGRQQITVKEEMGHIRLFIVDTNNNPNKEIIEKNITKQMAEITKDELWLNQLEIKALTLEHHMAASRGNFISFFEALYNVEKYRMGLLDGSLQGISSFINIILPLVNARRDNNKLQIAQIVKKYSPLLSKESLENSVSPQKNLQEANLAVNALFALFENGKKPKLIEIVKSINVKKLLDLPEIFNSVLSRESISDDVSDDIAAWKNALNCEFSEFEAYASYLSDNSSFGTHQGIKGLEFDRVLAIIDDEESRGFLFKYDKLFGVSELSKTDIENFNEGKETSVDRARRLFYVICTRAKQSLAVVAYTRLPELLKEKIKSHKWFNEEEIVCL